MKLEGKTAVVTGGDRGIGRALAIALAREGANIVVTYNTNKDAAVKTSNDIERLGRRSLVFKVDVRSTSEIKNMINESTGKFGKIDILVNAAGICSLVGVLDMSEEEWDSVMDVNMKGTFLCSKYVAKEMIRQKVEGKIVNISSRAGKIGMAGIAHYSASKFAVLGFTQAFALELIKHGIRVNAICPGRTDTDMVKEDVVSLSRIKNISIEQARKEYAEPIPLGRFATPDEIANVAVFLCSDESRYIIGESINVTGGLDLTRGGN